MAHLEAAKSTEFCPLLPRDETLRRIPEPRGGGFHPGGALPEQSGAAGARPASPATPPTPMFGDVQAKLNGCATWIYYTGHGPRAKILALPALPEPGMPQLPAPRPRSFPRRRGCTQTCVPEPLSNKTSCKECHEQFHDVANRGPAIPSSSRRRLELASRTRLLRAGSLISLGLAVQAATFFFGGPLPFLVFAPGRLHPGRRRRARLPALRPLPPGPALSGGLMAPDPGFGSVAGVRPSTFPSSRAAMAVKMLIPRGDPRTLLCEIV